MKTMQGEIMIQDKKLSDYKFCYVRGKNSAGDTQGVLFELEKDWNWVKKESNKIIMKDDFAELIRTVCDLRGIKVRGLPVDSIDIQSAIESFRQKDEDTKTIESKTYDILDNGLLCHKKSRKNYISGYGCSCILIENPDKKEIKKRGYRNGLSASKSIIRTMTPYGNWKTSCINEDSEVFFDDHALYHCSNDFFADGNHHKVKGNIPTEVFQMARNLQYTFFIENDHI
jgi:hypothetical protein